MKEKNMYIIPLILILISSCTELDNTDLNNNLKTNSVKQKEVLNTNEINKMSEQVKDNKNISSNEGVKTKQESELTNDYNFYCSKKQNDEKEYLGCIIDVIKFKGKIDNCEKDIKDQRWTDFCKEQWAKYSGDIGNCRFIPENKQKGCHYSYETNSIPKQNIVNMPILNFSIGTKDFTQYLPYKYENINYSSQVDVLFSGYHYGAPSIYITTLAGSRLFYEYSVIHYMSVFSSNGELIASFSKVGGEGGNDKTRTDYVVSERIIPDEEYGKVLYFVNYIIPPTGTEKPEDYYFKKLEVYKDKEWAFIYPVQMPKNKLKE